MSAQADHLAAEAARSVAETRRLSDIGSSTEETFYPAIRELLTAILRAQNLPFEVRTATSEAKQAGTDRPDFILADSGLFVGVFGAVKKPDETLEDIAVSTERDDQIGRYLSRTGVVLVNNARGFGLLASAPGYVREQGTPVPPDQRDLIATVDLWSNASGKGAKLRVDAQAQADLFEPVHGLLLVLGEQLDVRIAVGPEPGLIRLGSDPIGITLKRLATAKAVRLKCNAR